MKNKLLYYDILGYRSDSKKLMHTLFDVITIEDPRFDQLELLSEIQALIAPLGFLCDARKIEKCPNLSVIGSNTTGEAHIDTKYAIQKGITVVSLMNEQKLLHRITPTAEHTMGLLLSVTRKIPSAFNSVKNGRWNRRSFGGKRMLLGQTIGIVGLGRLGSWVAKYADAFGMSVCYYDPYIRINKVNENWTSCATLTDLVSISDVITLHVPSNSSTRHLIGREIIDVFKSGSVFINTSRAECVDERALLDALIGGHISAAGLDVLSGEFNPDFEPTNNALVEYAQTHDNLIITPHIGGSTEDAWALTEQFTLRKMNESI